MLKINLLLRYLLLLSLLWPASLFAQLTIHVTSVPANTPPEDEIYIAGNFNNWNPGNVNYILTDLKNGSFSITFSPNPGTLEFKFTRGSWETVEGTANGGFRPNRVYNYNGGNQNIDVVIEGWENIGEAHTATDNVHIIDEDFEIPQLNRTRRIWIYLPPDYDSTSKNYPVLYMHDGQNLFDAFYSFAGEWEVDESMNELFNAGDFGAIVVGIDNGGNERIDEYSAWVNSAYGGGDGELYAAFLVNTLKPYIDTHYRTLPGRDFTAIAGSSMGANISMFAAIEYPETFSKVGIFSPAFWFSDSIYYHVNQEGIQDEMRFYFVAGDNESASMLPKIMAMYDTLSSLGVDESDLLFLHHADGAHSEWYWAREYPTAYEWLFDELILSIQPPRSIKRQLYPNPAGQALKIESMPHGAPYKIFNHNGKQMATARSTKDTIDISKLLPGLYVLEVQFAKNEVQVFRFVKQ